MTHSLKDTEIVVQIYANGKMDVNYNIHNPPKNNVRELGIKFVFYDEFDFIAWDREAHWSYYPQDHLGCPKGKTALYTPLINKYREEPSKPWHLDTRSFYYNADSDQQGLTHLAKSTKENIYK